MQLEEGVRIVVKDKTWSKTTVVDTNSLPGQTTVTDVTLDVSRIFVTILLSVILLIVMLLLAYCRQRYSARSQYRNRITRIETIVVRCFNCEVWWHKEAEKCVRFKRLSSGTPTRAISCSREHHVGNGLTKISVEVLICSNLDGSTMCASYLTVC